MKKVIYYTDEKNDDFAPTNGRISTKRVDGDYPYRHGPLWRLGSWAVYRLLATPLVWLYCKLAFGLRIKNKRALRGLLGRYYLYANHTTMTLDAFLPTLLAFPYRGDVVTGPDAVSLPGLGGLVQMLGAVPLPTGVRGMNAFLERLQRSFDRRRAVLIYPEAHIWPFYNGIRPFSDASFSYPVRFGVPAVGAVVVWRKRRILRRLPPLATVWLSDPVSPPPQATPRAARRHLRGQIYRFMCDTAAREHSYAYIEYVKVQQPVQQAQEVCTAVPRGEELPQQEPLAAAAEAGLAADGV